MYRNTAPPWLTSHHGGEKQDKWTVGEKDVNRNNKHP